MSAPLRLSTTQPAPPSGDSISVWLDTLSVLLKMPSAKRDSIRDELESHLRERVHDLMVKGQPESDAVRHAIGELGDAVKLAERLRAAGRNPRRRLMMNLAVFGVAGAALLTSVVALNGGPNLAVQPEGQRASIEIAARFATPQESKSPKVSITPTMKIGEFLKQLSDSAGMPVVVRWKLLEAIDASAEVNLAVENSLADISLREAIDLINESLTMRGGDSSPTTHGDGLDYRISDNRLTVATIAYFDKVETVLVAYDLRPQVLDRARQLESKSVIEATEKVTEEVRRVLQELVQKELWIDNGGDRASIAVYGTKLFIRAPKRFHPEIEWVISQLPVNDNTVEVPILDDVPVVFIKPEEAKPEVLDPRLIVESKLVEPKPAKTAK